MTANNPDLTSEDYHYIYSRSPRLCVDLQIESDEGILLTRRAIPPQVGTWHFPGGRVQYKETIEQAAARIAQAELGITVKLGQYVGYAEFLEDGPFVHSVALEFLAQQTGGTIQLNEQASEFKWFKTVPEDMHPVHRRFWQEHPEILARFK